ncbi:hypothetical protein AMJ57_01920 [Parcubacteria bacterium SG8_24]|nr:MAG: hypothetical protein AMJ57_01920 [Parcubacteria bacterium SG8_24]
MYRNLFILLIVLSTVYLAIPFSADTEHSSMFLTVSTFLFAILTGFFIARQNSRYNQIREQIATFDGNITALYRGFGQFGDEVQKKAAKIINRHYRKILEMQQWDYHFMHKSSTIKELGSLLHETVGQRQLPSGPHLVLRDMIQSLDGLQVARKNMVALQVERIPKLPQTLIYFLAIMLLFVLALIPSTALMFDALLKGAFGTIVIFLVILLRQLDDLHLFEGTLGEASAQDVLNILSERR